MSHTHRPTRIALAVLALMLAINAFASAGGRYAAEDAREAATPSPTQQSEAAERSPQDTWDTLRNQVPDLDAKEPQTSKPVAVVPKPQAVRGNTLICERVAPEGTRIKRRVCRPASQSRARARNEMITSQVFRWSTGNP
ncbi:MAG: hypothetical protein AAF184_23680 [Pseudomonadota bacterium]